MFKTSFARTEIKYRLSASQYDSFLSSLQGIAHIDEYGKSKIMNIYYDTPDFRMIRASLEKPMYKEKLRLRTYGVPSAGTTAFAEIKKKYKGTVYKRRIAMPYSQALGYLAGRDEPAERNQISNEIDYLMKVWENLAPTAVISYDRIALTGDKDPDLRITFDDNIRYRTTCLDLSYGEGGREILAEGEHLMELKVSGAVPLEIVRLLSANEIYPSSFSKYGRAYTEFTAEKQSLKENTKIITPVLTKEGVFRYA